MDDARAEPVIRYVVLGAPGSGKTHLAARVAEATGLEVVELDQFYWLPGWARRPKDDFVDLVAATVRSGPAVVVGNYLAWAPALLWPMATRIVWLDLPRRVTVRRLAIRTVRQAVRQEEVLPGCRQSLRAALRDGLFRTGWNEPGQLRESVPRLLREFEIDPWRVVRLSTTKDVGRWIAGEGVTSR